MVRDEDDRRRIRVGRPRRERSNQLFPSSEIETGARLVENDDTGVVHQGAREQDSLEFTRRQRSDFSVAEVSDVHALEADFRRSTIGFVIDVPPRFESRVLRRHHGCQCRQLRAETVGEGSGQVTDSLSEGAHIRRTEGLTEDLDAPRRRMVVEGCDADERRLSRPIRSEHQPPLVSRNREMDVVQDRRAISMQTDRLQFQWNDVWSLVIRLRRCHRHSG